MICIKCRAAGTANSVGDVQVAVMFHQSVSSQIVVVSIRQENTSKSSAIH
jgi:hypothetical protein